MKNIHPTLRPAPYRKTYLQFTSKENELIPEDWELTALEAATNIRVGLSGKRELFLFRQSLRNPDGSFCTLKNFAKLLLSIDKDIFPYPSAALVRRVETEIDPVPTNWRDMFSTITERWNNQRKPEPIVQQVPVSQKVSPIVGSSKEINPYDAKFHAVLSYWTMDSDLSTTKVIEILKLLGPNFDKNLELLNNIKESLITKAGFGEEGLASHLTKL